MFLEMSDKNIVYYGALLLWLFAMAFCDGFLRRLYRRVFNGLIDNSVVHNYGNYMGTQK